MRIPYQIEMLVESGVVGVAGVAMSPATPIVNGMPLRNTTMAFVCQLPIM